LALVWAWNQQPIDAFMPWSPIFQEGIMSMTTVEPVTTDDASRQKVWDMIKDIQIALMVTTDDEGLLRSRPMAVQQRSFEGDLWFFTNVNSGKVDHIEGNPGILLAYADPGSQNYVSVTGEAEIVRDRAQIKALWSDMLKIWFPDGPDDPDIALIKVRMKMAEYWDSPSSVMVLAYGYLKSSLTGEKPRLGEHKRVRF
jgi:general stress protein 26